MSSSSDDSFSDILDESHGTFPPSFINLLRDSDSNEDFSIDPPPPNIAPENTGSLCEASATLNANEDFWASLLQTVPLPAANVQTSLNERWEIIAQPYCTTKVRYRTDYQPPSTRRHPLKNKNPESNFTGPAIRIPRDYLDPEKYSIGVSLATPMHKETKICYVHPYELESIDHTDYNDRANNIVWYPIDEEDLNGIKSFPDLRIVRRTEDDLEDDGDLQPFHMYNTNLLNNNRQINKLSTRQRVVEYNLKNAHLVFFIGQKINITNQFPTIIKNNLILFSDEMPLFPCRIAGQDDKSNSSPLPDWEIHKYAPKYGCSTDGDEMLIFLTKKPQQRKYGKIQITFESAIWSTKVDTIEIKDRMISFPIPRFPYPINAPTPVNVVLRQGERFLQTRKYSYIPEFQFATTQADSTGISNSFARSNSNKRTKSSLNTFDDESDAIVQMFESKLILQQMKSEPESNSSNTTPEISTNTNEIILSENPIMQTLHESMKSLFLNNDYQPLLRTCRLHIQKCPELLHHAINNNYSDLVSTFVPIGGMELMQKKNEHGETVLLHATRLNRIRIVQAVLERKESDKLLEDKNNNGQNIFHILALNTDSNEIFDLIIKHLSKKSIDISNKFDYADQDNYTPLQLAILNNNLSATRHLLKYFNKNLSKISNDTNENLIHLAVRHGDLALLKYLINEGELIEQGNQTSLSMTPIELAQSLKRHDMVNYLKEIYPQSGIIKDENSNND